MHRHPDLGRRRPGHERRDPRRHAHGDLPGLHRKRHPARLPRPGERRDHRAEITECEQHHTAGRHDAQDRTLP